MDSDDKELKIENSRKREKKEKKSHFGILLAVLLVIAAGSGLYFGINGGKLDSAENFVLKLKTEFSRLASKNQKDGNAENAEAAASSSSAEKDLALTFDSESGSVFAEGKKGFYHFSRDGAKFYDYSQKQLWNSTFTMTSVFSVGNGDYTALAETQGRNLKMYKSDGEVYSLNTDGIITDVNVCSTGELSLIMKCSDEYRIQVYSSSGELEFERYEEDEGVYPVKTAMSSDGRILAVSYIDTEGIEVEGKILLFYKDRNDSKNSETGDFFAAVEKKGQIVPMAGYSDKWGFMFVGDREIFAVSPEGKESFSVELKNRIDKAVFTKNGSVIAAMGDELSGKDGYKAGSVVIYSGESETLAASMENKVTYLKAYDSGVIAGSGNDYCFISNGGKLQWRFKAGIDISDIIPLDGNNTLIVSSSRAEIFDAKKLEKTTENR